MTDTITSQNIDLSSWDTPYKEEQLQLRETLETAVRRVELLWDSLRPVRTWTRKLRKLRCWKPLPGDNQWGYSRLRSPTACCNKLQSVWISDSDIVISVGDQIIQFSIKTPSIATRSCDIWCVKIDSVVGLSFGVFIKFWLHYYVFEELAFCVLVFLHSLGDENLV
jgi:hypothetical protein